MRSKLLGFYPYIWQIIIEAQDQERDAVVATVEDREEEIQEAPEKTLADQAERAADKVADDHRLHHLNIETGQFPVLRGFVL